MRPTKPRSARPINREATSATPLAKSGCSPRQVSRAASSCSVALAHLCSYCRYACGTTIACRGKKNIEEEASRFLTAGPYAGACRSLPCDAGRQAAEGVGLGLRSEGHVCGRHGRCKRKLTSVQACGQALTFVQPHVARSRRRGPLWSSWIGSQSATRASEHSSHCWFIQSRSLTDCP